MRPRWIPILAITAVCLIMFTALFGIEAQTAWAGTAANTTDTLAGKSVFAIASVKTLRVASLA